MNNFQQPFQAVKTNLARQYAKIYPKEVFVGVSGAFNNDSTVQACLHVLSEKYPTISTKLNADPVMAIPETILRIRPRIKKVIIEMGFKDGDDLDFYLSLVKPKTVIITKVGFPKDRALEGELIESLPEDGSAILNGDDINSKNIAPLTKAQIIYFGKDQNNCTVWAGNIRLESYITKFELNYGVERVQIDYQLLGEHQIYSALAAATLGVIEGMTLVQIKRGLEKVEPTDHRLQLLVGPSNSIILDDSIDATPSSVEVAIDTLLALPARRRVVVLGDIKDLSETADSVYREIARKLYKEKVDLVLLGGGEVEVVADELKSLGFYDERLDSDLQNSQMVSKLLKVLQKGDVCLIKGSKVLRLDEVVKRIAKKGKD